LNEQQLSQKSFGDLFWFLSLVGIASSDFCFQVAILSSSQGICSSHEHFGAKGSNRSKTEPTLGFFVVPAGTRFLTMFFFKTHTTTLLPV
jgi:hypothetical protein